VAVVIRNPTDSKRRGVPDRSVLGVFPYVHAIIDATTISHDHGDWRDDPEYGAVWLPPRRCCRLGFLITTATGSGLVRGMDLGR